MSDNALPLADYSDSVFLSRTHITDESDEWIGKMENIFLRACPLLARLSVMLRISSFGYEGSLATRRLFGGIVLWNFFCSVSASLLQLVIRKATWRSKLRR